MWFSHQFLNNCKTLLYNWIAIFYQKFLFNIFRLKDKSRVVIIIDYSRYYTVVNGDLYLSEIFLVQSAKLHISFC